MEDVVALMDLLYDFYNSHGVTVTKATVKNSDGETLGRVRFSEGGEMYHFEPTS